MMENSLLLLTCIPKDSSSNIFNFICARMCVYSFNMQPAVHSDILSLETKQNSYSSFHEIEKKYVWMLKE